MNLKRCAVAGLLLLCAVAAAAFAQSRLAQKFPDVIDVNVRSLAGGSFDFDVTLSSPYDTPARYADAFRVSSVSGDVFGERVLFHDHENEQPFTRDLYGVKIPSAIKFVLVQGRDQKFGYGGKTMQVQLPGR